MTWLSFIGGIFGLIGTGFSLSKVIECAALGNWDGLTIGAVLLIFNLAFSILNFSNALKR